MVFTLEDTFNGAEPEPNDQGASLAVHLIFRTEQGNCTFCTWISDGVTRCNYVLGHVLNAGADQMVDEGDLLTIGLTFKDGFTKGHDGHTGGCSGEHPGPSSEWDWGDGSKDIVEIQDNSVEGSHTYSSTGIYTVTLNVTYT
ncbi:MAG: hypothetical protein E4G94_06340, partial [ANME-2 cluster archaeon]